MDRKENARLLIAVILILLSCILALRTYSPATFTQLAVPPLKVGGSPSNGCSACTLGWCTPDPGYTYCYDYRYGNAYVKVEIVPPNVYQGTNELARGTIEKYKVTGTGTVETTFNSEIPKCTASGCNGIPIGNNGIIVYGAYEVYIPNTQYLSTLEQGNGYRVILTSEGSVTFIWKTQPNYIVTGHSYASPNWAYAYIGFGEDLNGKEYKVLSAIVPESITLNPSTPNAGDKVTVTLDLHNYCKYDAAQKFTVDVYKNGVLKFPERTYVLWVDGNSNKLVKLSQQYIFNSAGIYKIVIKSPDGEQWSKEVVVLPTLPSGRIKSINITGYALTMAGIAALAYIVIRRFG